MTSSHKTCQTNKLLGHTPSKIIGHRSDIQRSRPTCKVDMCLSLNLFSTYRRTSDVLPTAPSPRRTTLKETRWESSPVEFAITTAAAEWSLSLTFRGEKNDRKSLREKTRPTLSLAVEFYA